MAGIKVRELFTAWGFNIDSKPINEMNKQIDATKQALKYVLGGITAAGVTLFGFAKFTADSRLELNKMAQQVGINVEVLKELQYAARLSHVDTDSLGAGLRLLSRSAYEAAHGGEEAQKSYRAVGVSVRDQHGNIKDGAALLLEISSRFHNMPDGIEKTALALQVFGRGGVGMIPFLNKGPEALQAMMRESRQFGTIDAAKIHKAEMFEQALVRIGAIIKQLRNMIGDAAIGPMTAGMEQLGRLVMDNLDNIRATVTPLINLALTGLTAIFNLAMTVGGAAMSLVNVLGGLEGVLRVILGLAAAFAAGKAILMVFSLVRAVWGMVAALTAVNGELLMANLLSGGLPLLIGAGVLGADYLSRGNRSIAGSLFGDASAVPVHQLAGAGNGATSNLWHVEPKINVTVPAYSNPEQAGQAIGLGVGSGIAKELQKSRYDFSDLQAR